VSGDIGPGDFVEALMECPKFGITVGRVCTVLTLENPDDVWPCRNCGDASGGFLLKETPEANEYGSWCPCGWKPIHRPKPDAFADLLKVPAFSPLTTEEDALV